MSSDDRWTAALSGQPQIATAKDMNDLQDRCAKAESERDELQAEVERLRDRVGRAEDRLAMELDKQIEREQNRLANLKEMRRLADEADYHVKDIVDLTRPPRT